MADTAFQNQYRQEYVAGFEQRVSYFRATATTERVVKGNTAYFLLADTGDAEAVTRGTNGLIPGRTDTLDQKACTLLEWHDKPKRTKFNIFASQGDGRRILQEGSIKVLNRKLDDLMITELSTGTNDTGSAETFSLNLVAKSIAILGENDVPTEEMSNMFGALSPAAFAYAMQIKEFASADYVDVKLFNGAVVKMRNWYGVNWFQSNRLSGRTTNAEKCLLWHRDAIGWAVATEDMETAGYNEEESYYWARTSAFMGAKLLQNEGVVVMNHDGSAYVAVSMRILLNPRRMNTAPLFRN